MFPKPIYLTFPYLTKLTPSGAFNPHKLLSFHYLYRELTINVAHCSLYRASLIIRRAAFHTFIAMRAARTQAQPVAGTLQPTLLPPADLHHDGGSGLCAERVASVDFVA